MTANKERKIIGQMEKKKCLIVLGYICLRTCSHLRIFLQKETQSHWWYSAGSYGFRRTGSRDCGWAILFSHVLRPGAFLEVRARARRTDGNNM